LFQSGFETGSFSDWAGTVLVGSGEVAQVTAAAARTGTFGAQFSNGAAAHNGAGQSYQHIAPSTRVVTLQADVKVDSVSGDGTLRVLELHHDAPLYNAVAQFQYSNGLWQFSMRGLNGSPITSGPVPFGLSAWHQVQLTYDASLTQPVLRGVVDGAQVADLADASSGTMYVPNFVYVGAFETSWSVSGDVSVDNVQVVDGSGVVQVTPSMTSTPTPSPSATPTSTPTTLSLSTATPTPSPSPTQTTGVTPVSGSLAIGAVSANASSVAEYTKYELTFPIGGSVATNLQFPYDPAPPPGLNGRIGITVEGLFLPPGQSDWSQAVHQPAFLYQDYDRQQINGKDWIAAKNNAVWKIRFAATAQGTWQYLIRAQDASTCSSGANPCTAWVQTPVSSFSVGAPASHGFLRVSPTDNRYFAFDDGTPFAAEGINDSFTDDTYGADSRLATYAANGMSLVRAWMSSSTLAGSAWSPWVVVGSNQYGGYLPEPGLVATSTEPGHDFVFDLNQSTGRPCIFNGWSRGFIAVRPNTTYEISADVKAFNMTPASSGQPYGFTLKLGDWPSTGCANLASVQGLVPDTANTNGWTTVSGTLTTGTGQYFLNYLYMDLDNVSAGEAYVGRVSLRAVQAGGQFGPEMLAKSRSDAHTDFNEQASYAWDHIIDTAAQDNVYLKLVVLEKNDRVWNEIQANGAVTTADSNSNFYSSPNTKVRTLQQYYWRYLAARWGYSTAVHSWELLNEGDPYNGNHYNQADSFASYMHQTESSRHMVTTSAWAAFPVDTFWGNPQYPNADYADVHAYVSTGFGSEPYPWSLPSGMTLEANTANTYHGSAGALRIGAGVTSSTTALPIRGQGTWNVSALVKASGVSGTCPYGASSSLAGPQIDITISGGPHRVFPYDPNNPDQYWICTAPAGTYDYTPIQGTFTLNDGGWHTLNLGFKTAYATAGTVWYDNLVIQSPDGRTARILGDGTFDDYERNDYDTGLFNLTYGLVDGAKAVSGAGKPVIRGETGIDYPGGPQQEVTNLPQDTKGVWLHNLLWGSLNAGGLTDLYWWTSTIAKNNLYFQYKPLHDFLSSIPFANGHYVDAKPVVSSANVHAIGQTDTTNGHGYVWVWNKNHTWFNVVNSTAWGSLGGTVSVPGLAPGRAYAVQLWEFDTNGTLTRTSVNVTADPSGSLNLDLSTLPSSVTDAALQF
jgi:hypothetical protein